MRKPVNTADYRDLAKRRLPQMVFDYLEGGAEDEIGLQHNRDVFHRVKFQPRRLVDVSKRSTRTSLFGKPLVKHPVNRFNNYQAVGMAPGA
jgi:(S)-mandelate dehydrogenase